jgi:hypothetical protein
LQSQAPDVDGVVYLEGVAAHMPVGTFVEVELIKVKGFDFIAKAISER